VTPNEPARMTHVAPQQATGLAAQPRHRRPIATASFPRQLDTPRLTTRAATRGPSLLSAAPIATGGLCSVRRPATPRAIAPQVALRHNHRTAAAP